MSDGASSNGFEAVRELAAAIPPKDWLLIGGVMVHAHAHLAGVPAHRPTADSDIVVAVSSTLSYAQAAARLRALGFEPVESLDAKAPVYRFARGWQTVDMLVPDRGELPRFAMRPTLAAPGSASALKSTEWFELGDRVRVRIPDLVGALSMKGAATQTASANSIRHAQDGVVLFACGQIRGLGQVSKSARRNIDLLIRRLDSLEAWSLTNAAVRLRAVRCVQQFRPSWRPPAGVLPSR